MISVLARSLEFFLPQSSLHLREEGLMEDRSLEK